VVWNIYPRVWNLLIVQQIEKMLKFKLIYDLFANKEGIVEIEKVSDYSKIQKTFLKNFKHINNEENLVFQKKKLKI
jgi:hypothetical protein